jgi:hypothetical protein
VIINDIALTRSRKASGEEWSYFTSTADGTRYWRETIHVKHL